MQLISLLYVCHPGWFQKIYDASLQPNILSFNNLLGACTMFGSVSEARAVLERMTKAQVDSGENSKGFVLFLAHKPKAFNKGNQ